MYIVEVSIAGTSVINLLVQEHDALLACNEAERAIVDSATSFFKQALNKIEEIKKRYLLRGYFLEYSARRVSKDELPIGMANVPYIQQIMS